jgi:hypothetical protein
MYTTENEIASYLRSNDIYEGTWELKDGLVSVGTSVFIRNTHAFMTRLPIDFGEVLGSFGFRSDLNLTTLEGCPHTVMKSFDCSGMRNLKSLKGLPKKTRILIIQGGLPAIEYLPALFSNVEDYISVTQGEGSSSQDIIIEKILENGRVDGKMDRLLIPEKINQLRDMK